MKREFVKTDNAKRFAAAMALKASRGAQESGLVVVHGRAGEGKTRTLHNWAAGVNAVMLTAYPGWTVRRMMVELAEKLHIVTKGQWEATLVEQIGAEEIDLVVDEAGFALADSAACLERLRSITDKSGTLLVMALMERDMGRLKQHDQITSRATLCPFATSSEDDVAAACAQLSDIQIAPDLVHRIWRDADARMRLVIEAIHTVETVAKGLGKQQLTAADVAKYALCQDFNRSLRGATANAGATKGARA